MDTPGKITRNIKRADGTEVRIVAQKCFGRGLHCSIDVFVHRRESPNHPWKLTSNQPHPDWRKMSVDQYVRQGRSEMLRVVSHGEILKVTSALMSQGIADILKEVGTAIKELNALPPPGANA